MSNSLGNISNINLDSFKTDATYYLSKSGEVKKAGLWFNFKLWANIGNSRSKVIDLLNAVKDKMVSATDSAASIVNFEDSIKNKKDKYNVKLSTLLQNFKASNADSIFVGEAKKIAEAKAGFFAERIPCDSDETRQELKKFLFKIQSSFYHKPPLKNSEDGKGKVLDEKKFYEETRDYLETIKDDFLEKLETGKRGKDCLKEHLELDSMYLKYYKKNLFEKLWFGGLTRNEVKLGDIKSKKDAFADSLVSIIKPKIDAYDDSLLSDPSLLEKEQFPEIAEHLKSVLDEDGLLKNILTKYSFKKILVNDNGNLRTLDEVKEKIKDIRKNFDDLTDYTKSFLDKTKDGLLKNILTKNLKHILVNVHGIGNLRTLEEVKEKFKDIKKTFDDLTYLKFQDGTSKKIAGEFLTHFVRDRFASNTLKEGSAQKVFNMINTEAPKLFGGISENPSPKELSKLMENIQSTIDTITVDSGILYADSLFAPGAVRSFILGEMISNLSPNDQEKVFKMTNSLSFAKVYTILDNHTDALGEKQESTDDKKLYEQLGQKHDNGVLLKSVMESLKSAAFTVANPDKLYIPKINKEMPEYVGIDMKSKMANTVIENFGMNSDKI